uniref:Uncharacterized protein n=1 Tax=Ixodes ricinus TaxID=34613 RepID=A0A6B0TT78_IXORI
MLTNLFSVSVLHPILQAVKFTFSTELPPFVSHSLSKTYFNISSMIGLQRSAPPLSTFDIPKPRYTKAV